MNRRSVLLILAMLALPAFAGERAPHPGAVRDRAEEREVYERYHANEAALKQLVAEATELQTRYLETGDLPAFRKAGTAWEVKARKWLARRLAPLYADEFTAATYQGPDLPAGRPAEGRAAWQRIEAQKRALRNDLGELRKPD